MVAFNISPIDPAVTRTLGSTKWSLKLAYEVTMYTPRNKPKIYMMNIIIISFENKACINVISAGILDKTL